MEQTKVSFGTQTDRKQTLELGDRHIRSADEMRHKIVSLGILAIAFKAKIHGIG